jgi:hypothetical protein
LAKPNYQYEKRQKDLAKKKKQEEKRQKKVDKSSILVSEDADAVEVVETPTEPE